MVGFCKRKYVEAKDYTLSWKTVKKIERKNRMARTGKGKHGRMKKKETESGREKTTDKIFNKERLDTVMEDWKKVNIEMKITKTRRTVKGKHGRIRNGNKRKEGEDN